MRRPPIARIVITGMGVISAIGNNVAETWDSLANGRSGIATTTQIPPELLQVKISAEVKGFDPRTHLTERQASLLDRFAQLGVVAAREAVAASGLTFDAALGARTATVIGTGVGGIKTLDENYERLYRQNLKVHPFCIPRFMPNAGASAITMEFGLTGPGFAIASACASANHAIAIAQQMLRSGACDVAITGGCEATIALGTMRGWEAMRIMAPDGCRPFSAGRRGMVLGEGAGIFVLEPLDRALARGAPILAELAGTGMSSDASDITLPNVEGPTSAMRLALADAGLAPEAIDYINAHGTGTVANDATETKAIHAVFGAHARKLALSSTKSMHGHALGAAGGIELAATLLAMQHNLMPPTINYTAADPACDLDVVPNEPRARAIDAALSNSFAFGGLNAVVAVKRYAR
jgi:nodulation protein E